MRSRSRWIDRFGLSLVDYFSNLTLRSFGLNKLSEFSVLLRTRNDDDDERHHHQHHDDDLAARAPRSPFGRLICPPRESWKSTYYFSIRHFYPLPTSSNWPERLDGSSFVPLNGQQIANIRATRIQMIFGDFEMKRERESLGARYRLYVAAR